MATAIHADPARRTRTHPGHGQGQGQEGRWRGSGNGTRTGSPGGNPARGSGSGIDACPGPRGLGHADAVAQSKVVPPVGTTTTNSRSFLPVF